MTNSSAEDMADKARAEVQQIRRESGQMRAEIKQMRKDTKTAMESIADIREELDEMDSAQVIVDPDAADGEDT